MEGNSMKNNKGFTLVELIVVIALMAIIAGVSTTVISSVSKQELKDFTNNLDAMLCQTKVETMSGLPDPALEIAIVDGEYRATLYKYHRDPENRAEVKSQYLGEDYLTCAVPGITMGPGKIIRFTYNRSTGELQDNTLTELIVSDKSGTEYEIQFFPQTGYHKIVR